VEALDRTVRSEHLQHVVLTGDEVVLPLLREQLPKQLANLVVDHLKLDAHASIQEVLDATLDAMRRDNERSDRTKVDAAVSAYRAGGLGVVGPAETLDALVKGQVDELLIAASAATLEPVDVRAAAVLGSESTLLDPAVETTASGEAAEADPQAVRLADELVTRAKQTSARVTFIEDASLLEDYGGVAALLRFRV
jgi:peptide subunit release factor 1 (eRF1)